MAPQISTPAGEFASLLSPRFRLACKRLNLNTVPLPALNTQLFEKIGNLTKNPDQLSFSWD